jgi:putative acetyltransferase
MTAPALRPYLPKDAPALVDLIEASIMELAEEDYSEDQRAAWAEALLDEARFARRLESQLTLVVEGDEGLLGVASLKDSTVMDLLYVRPDQARRGVATLLCEAIERLAAARKATAITADVSDNAQPFFAGRGYVGQSRNTKILGGEWLANTTMRKTLAVPAGTGKP